MTSNRRSLENQSTNTSATTGTTAPADGAILLTEKQAAELLSLSPRTLQAWRQSGDGPQYVRISARAIRYRREDLDRWVEERLCQSTSQATVETL